MIEQLPVAVATAMNAALGILLVLGLRDLPAADTSNRQLRQAIRRATEHIAGRLTARCSKYEPKHRAPDETDLMRDEAAI